MPSSPGGIRVNPNGQSAVVTFTLPNGGTPVAYSSKSGAGTISLPATVTTETTFWFQEQTVLTVSALVGTQQSATAAGTTATVDLSAGGVAGLLVAVVAASGGSSVASGLTPTAVKTANYTAAAGDLVPGNVTSAGFTVTLPTNPAVGTVVGVYKTDASGNTLTIAPAGGGTIDGDANATTTTKNAGATFEHLGSNAWKVVSSYITTGPAGPQGATGPAGATGATGATGPAGVIAQVQDEGSTLTARGTLNFIGAGVTAADNSGSGRTDITIPGATGITPWGVKSGKWQSAPVSAASASARAAGNLDAMGLLVPTAFTAQTIAVEVTTAGGTGCVGRLGIYAVGTDGFPGALLLDAGTVTMDTTGVKSITISQAIPAGLVFLAVAVQGTFTGNPSFRVCGGNATLTTQYDAFPGSQTPSGYVYVSVTGALPAAASSMTYTGPGATARLALQVA